MNLQTAQIEQRFHRGIRPTQYSQLSDQCQLVTNITQNMIQGRPTISMVLDDFDDCLRKFCTTNSVLFPKANVFEENRDYVIFCTWSDSDLGHILPNECLQKNINYGDYLKYWIDGQRIVAVSLCVPLISVRSKWCEKCTEFLLQMFRCARNARIVHRNDGHFFSPPTFYPCIKFCIEFFYLVFFFTVNV